MFNNVDDENEISKWKLTEKELKSIKGYENVSSEEADNIINTVVQLALLAYNN